MDAKFAVSFRSDWFGSRRRGRDFIFSSADVDLNNFEIFNIGDASISIFVNTLEDVFWHVIGADDSQELIGVVDKFSEFLESH